MPLVIWPESAIEVIMPKPCKRCRWSVMPALKSDRAYFIFGAKSFRGKPGRRTAKHLTPLFLPTPRTDSGPLSQTSVIRFRRVSALRKILSWIPAHAHGRRLYARAGPVVFHLAARGAGRAADLLRRSDARMLRANSSVKPAPTF